MEGYSAGESTCEISHQISACHCIKIWHQHPHYSPNVNILCLFELSLEKMTLIPISLDSTLSGNISVQSYHQMNQLVFIYIFILFIYLFIYLFIFF